MSEPVYTPNSHKYKEEQKNAAPTEKRVQTVVKDPATSYILRTFVIRMILLFVIASIRYFGTRGITALALTSTAI